MVRKNLRKLIVRMKRDWYLPWAGLGTLLAIISLAGIAYLAARPVGEFDISPKASGENVPSPLKGIFGVVPVTETVSVSGKESFDLKDVRQMLDNPAISGIALRIRWRDLQPVSENEVDFTVIDQILSEAKSRQKSVSLILVPGFYSPRWLIDRLDPCEKYIANPGAFPGSCGRADFDIDYGGGSGGGEKSPLPIPWNETYIDTWKTFLRKVADRYNDDPAVVSVAVAGPTSMSVEMSLPGDAAEDFAKWKNILELYFPAGDPHRGSNLIVIEKWQEMIDFYGQIFTNKVIVATRGAGLLKFISRDEDPNALDPRHPQESKEIIINYFIQKPYPNNFKANQTSGLKACRGFEEGIDGVKRSTLQGQIGGAQFNSSAANNPITMGCQDRDFCGREDQNELKRFCGRDPKIHPCCSLSAEQAVGNVLQEYFNETKVGDKYGGVSGPYSVHYLQLYARDILFAKDSPQMQEILNRAKADLESMTAPPGPSPTPVLNPRQKSRGVSSLTKWSAAPDNLIWENGNVDAVVLRVYWKDLNPAAGTYQWQIIDSALEKAAKSKKQLKIVIAPGFYSPDWVIKQVKTENFTVPQGPFQGKSAPLPIPWDEKYLGLWFAFLDKLAQRYGNNSSFGYIALAGPNSHNGEAALPREISDREQWLRISGSEQQLKDKLFGAWSATIDHYQKNFGSRGIYFGLSIILDSLPVNNPDLQWQYKLDLINYPLSKNMKYFAVQTNGLDGRPVCPAAGDPLRHWNLIKDNADKILVGFQTNAPLSLYSCPEGMTKKQILSQTVTNAVNFGGNFLEIYEGDVGDPALAEVISLAHNSLGSFLPSPTPTPTPTSSPTPTTVPLPPVPEPIANNFTVQAILQYPDGRETPFSAVNAVGITRFEEADGSQTMPRVDYAKCMSGGTLSLPIAAGGTPCGAVAPGRYATQWKKTVKINKQEYNLLWPNTGCTNKVCEQSEMITGGQPIHRGVYQAPTPKPTKIPKKSR